MIGDSAPGFLPWILLLFFYILPTLVALNRKVPHIGSIAVVNLLLGWTLIGWVVALAMAARSRPQTTTG